MLFDQIKKDRMKARQEQDTFKSGVLTVVLGELENERLRGKNVDNEFVIRKIKKDVANMKEFMSGDKTLKEIEILEEYLPKQMDEQQLRAHIEHYKMKAIKDGVKSPVGFIMKTLKEEYAGLYDGKMASQIAKEVLNG